VGTASVRNPLAPCTGGGALGAKLLAAFKAHIEEPGLMLV
jgi:hypothetical protein